eukprot:15366289-Ditylum_brightwellii.AAC.1
MPLNKTALIDSVASISLVNNDAPTNKAPNQESQKRVTLPNGCQLSTVETMNLQIDGIPDKAKIRCTMKGRRSSKDEETHPTSYGEYH